VPLLEGRQLCAKCPGSVKTSMRIIIIARYANLYLSITSYTIICLEVGAPALSRKKSPEELLNGIRKEFSKNGTTPKINKNFR